MKEKIGERLPILRPIEGGPNGDKLVLLEIAVHDGPDLTVRSLPLLHSHIVARERGQHLWRLCLGAGLGATGSRAGCGERPWHLLYFLPLPHGHGRLRLGVTFTFAAELRLNDDPRNGLHVRTSRAPTDNNYWKRATKRVGVAGRLVHDLRRKAAREFRRAGMSE